MSCSNAPKTRNPLKFARVPQTRQQISAVSRAKFTILSGHVDWRRYCCITSFFLLSIHALVAKIWPDKVVRWRRDGDFCVLYLQRAACSAFQTCIQNCTKATPCVQVWQTSTLQRLRLGEEKKKKEQTTG